ncbi:hypothetical protein PtB15_4B791 [Puccinia triticina]|nr:hypothetical protein PtB15_4B791 [Puccinia triticina]
MASPSDHSLLSNPSLPPNETAPDAQEDAGNVQEDAGNVQEDAGNVQEDAGNMQEDAGNVVATSYKPSFMNT